MSIYSGSSPDFGNTALCTNDSDSATLVATTAVVNLTMEYPPPYSAEF